MLPSYGVGSLDISIHALREEGDQRVINVTADQNNFYPRPPRGGRPAIAAACKTTDEFLSTPSARRATALPPSVPQGWFNFYPRPPRGGRRRR